MKTSLWVLASSLICFSALKADMPVDSLEVETLPIAENSAAPVAVDSLKVETPPIAENSADPVAVDSLKVETPPIAENSADPVAVDSLKVETPPTAENSAAPVAAAQQSMPQTQPQSQTQPQPQPTKKMSCVKADNPYRIDIKHIEAKGIGYNQGYTSLDGFFTSMWDDFIPFVDLRAHVFNNGRWAANVGLGTRYIFDPCQWMVGGNLYYDYRSTKHGHYNQIGAGAEAFYDRFEAHLNGYLPVGQKRRMSKQHLESVTFKGFSGNYILQNENYNNTYEGAMKGFNGEVGAHIVGDRKCYDLYFGVGPYYYDVSSGKHAWGGKARLKAEVTKYLFLELSDSYDRIFHNRVQGTVNVSIPFGGKLCYPSKSADCSAVMDWQAVLPVERQEIIVISKFKKKHTIDPVAIDPTTGQPFYVIFVNNTNDAGGNLGDGTFENPYSNLTHNDNNNVNAEDAAMDGNIIYVFAGDGSSTGMQGGSMQLQPSNRLLGSANSHPFQTTKGLLMVPALTTLVPSVTGPGNSNVINLANNCEISGFTISLPSASTGTCINGAAALVNGNINQNTLMNGAFGVIFGLNGFNSAATGNFIIENNTASGQAVSAGSAYFFQGVKNATFTVANNIAMRSLTSTITNAAGVNIQSFGGVVGTITNNTLTDVGFGIRIMGNAPGGSLPDLYTIRGNVVNNSNSTIHLNNNTTNNLLTLIVEENEFINTITSGFIGNNFPSGPLCIRFNNNKGYPSAVSPPYNIGVNGGNPITLETPINNFPQPSLSNNVSQTTPCACGQPCN